MGFSVRDMAGGDELGEALAGARRRLGCSVEAAAAMVGIDGVDLERIEAGLREPSGSVLESLADIYGVTVEELHANPWASP